MLHLFLVDRIILPDERNMMFGRGKNTDKQGEQMRCCSLNCAFQFLCIITVCKDALELRYEKSTLRGTNIKKQIAINDISVAPTYLAEMEEIGNSTNTTGLYKEDFRT